MPVPRIGSCSWKYASWEGLVYSAETGIDYLAEYALRYDCVEVDQWFWSLFERGEPRLPRPTDARQYRDAVPDGFLFAVKVPNSVTLTHRYKKAKTDPLIPNPHFLSIDLFAEFLERIDALGDVLGPVLFQFEYLNRQKMPSESAFRDRFGAFIEALPGGLTYGLEIRNPRYLNAGFFDYLRSLRVSPVLISGYWMPPLPEILDKQIDKLVDFENVILRLMGNDRQAIENATGGSWNEIVDPHDEEIAAVAQTAVRLAPSGVQPFLFINNHYEGSAPMTIERIRERLGMSEASR